MKNTKGYHFVKMSYSQTKLVPYVGTVIIIMGYSSMVIQKNYSVPKTVIVCINNKIGGNMALEIEQKKFITEKVKELGTMEKVKSFYHKDDNVSKYAHDTLTKILKIKGDQQ
jgi:hypothetical protein